MAFGRDIAHGSNGAILEQSWMMKMAREIARTVDQKREMERGQNLRAGREKERKLNQNAECSSSSVADAEAPPAYAY